MMWSVVLLVLVSAANVTTDEDISVNRRIVGGTVASLASFPFQVNFVKDGKTICGGSIIGPRHVLTAAHCFWNDTIKGIDEAKVAARPSSAGQTT